MTTRVIVDCSAGAGDRLSGVVRRSPDDVGQPFSGTLELVAALEDACSGTNSKENAMLTLFKDEGFDFEAKAVLGHAHAGAADVGEVFATVAMITDGDSDSWVQQWESTADRIAAIADGAAASNHRVSARDAYLRAATYYAAALTTVDGTADPEPTLQRIFKAHRHCYGEYVARLDTPPEAIEIPYEDTTLPGWFFSAGPGAKPTLILNNGSDGSVTFMFPGLGTAALARGYHVLVFDGPGQQSMLFERNIPFRPDWEHVITPIVDWLLARPDVDAERIALYGISQAGYWVPRALAFEHRIAAGVADGGVVDVSKSWLEHLPPELIAMLEKGQKKDFDDFMAIGMADASPKEQQTVAWRAKPYGFTDPYDTFHAVLQYRLGDLTQRITAPMLITDPDDEQFFAGQPQELYDALPGTKELVRFTEAEGANGHCEPMARALLEQRMFDWLDETLAS